MVVHECRKGCMTLLWMLLLQLRFALGTYMQTGQLSEACLLPCAH
jgi:hypothetical protein